MRLGVYFAFSTLATVLVVSTAVFLHPNWYAAVVSLPKSTITIWVLVNMAAVLAYTVGKLLVWIFLGRIRDVELEDLRQRLSLLCFDGFLFWTGGWFKSLHWPFDILPTVLLLLLSFGLHWISGDRVKTAFYETTGHHFSKLVRLGVLIVLLFVIDAVLFKEFIRVLWKGSKNVQIVGTIPFLVDLFEMGLGNLLRFGVNCSESVYLEGHPDEDDWEKKPLLFTGIDILCDSLGLILRILSLLLYASIQIEQFYKIVSSSFNIMRSIKALRKALHAHSELDDLTTSATASDLERESVCPICFDEMQLEAVNFRKQPRRLKCGHLMHFSCLKSWLSRSQLCPTCRQSVYVEKSAFSADISRGGEHQPEMVRDAQANEQNLVDQALNANNAAGEAAGPRDVPRDVPNPQQHGPQRHQNPRGQRGYVYETAPLRTSGPTPFEHDEEAAVAAILGGDRRAIRIGNAWFEYRFL